MMLVDRDKAREACAKVCEDKASEWSVQESARRWQRECAAAIRQLTLAECKVEVEAKPVAWIVTASEAIPYPHIERLVDIGSLQAGTKLYPSQVIESLSAQVAEARDYIVSASNDQIGGGDDPVRFLIASHAALAAQVAELRKHLTEIEFSANGYCPACFGWEVTKGQGCERKVHTKTCWLDAAKESGNE